MQFAAALPGASFRWKLAIGLVFACAGDWLVHRSAPPNGVPGILALALLGGLLAGRSAVRHSRAGQLATLAGTVFALALAWDPGLLSWTLFWLAAGMATLLPQTDRFDDSWRWAQRLFWQGLHAPLRPLIDLRRMAKVHAAGHGRRFGLRRTASLLTLPLVGGAVIVTLFCAANPILAQTVSSLLSIDTTVMAMVPRAMLWTLFFAMLWSLLRPSLLKRPLALFDGRGDLGLPGVSPASITISLVAFNAIFAVQNSLDAAYLWGTATLPDGMTLADYAHHGAYPLIATALLAALFLLVALRPGSESARSPVIRRLVTLWIAQNIVLVASSIQRTFDYVEAYSLTRLRIAALVWMLLVGFGLATICWRLLRDRSSAWLVNVNLAATAIVLTAICFLDLGTLPAYWNVRHAREVGGTGAALDLCYLGQQGESALLPLLELERRRDLGFNFRQRVHAVRVQATEGYGIYGGLLHARRREQAEALAEALPPVDLGDGERGCDGSLIPEVAPPSPPTAPSPAPQTQFPPHATAPR